MLSGRGFQLLSSNIVDILCLLFIFKSLFVLASEILYVFSSSGHNLLHVSVNRL